MGSQKKFEPPTPDLQLRAIRSADRLIGVAAIRRWLGTDPTVTSFTSFPFASHIPEGITGKIGLNYESFLGGSLSIELRRFALCRRESRSFATATYTCTSGRETIVI